MSNLELGQVCWGNKWYGYYGAEDGVGNCSPGPLKTPASSFLALATKPGVLVNGRACPARAGRALTSCACGRK